MAVSKAGFGRAVRSTTLVGLLQDVNSILLPQPVPGFDISARLFPAIVERKPVQSASHDGRQAK